MEKIYIITSGEYSDYGIDCCFSTQEKAKEFLEFINKEKGNAWSKYRIEEYPLDITPKIERMIRVQLKSPLLNSNIKNESINTWTTEGLSHQTKEYTEITYTGELIIGRIVNSNKNLEEERNRVKKVAYDTLKKIVYFMKVENMSIDDINEYLEK